MSKKVAEIARLLQVVLRLTRGRLPLKWGLVIAAAVVLYVLFQPQLERSFDLSLPTLPQPSATTQGDSDRRVPTRSVPPVAESRRDGPAESESPAAATSVLRSVGSSVFESPAGLRYTPGSKHGHRLKHLMAHAVDQPNRPGPHGVFTSNDVTQIVLLVDEAYLQAERGRATKTVREQGRTVHTVDLGRSIGYVGGELGNRRNRPPASHLRMVLQRRNVITAFPVVP